ncbi:MAG: VOC family protein [Pseudomonadota bacterium]
MPSAVTIIRKGAPATAARGVWATMPAVDGKSWRHREAAMQHHSINYIELSVTDMEAAKAFYTAAFDWTFNDYGPGYQGIQHGDGESGGLCLADAVTTGGPLIVLYSSALEDSLDRVKQAGGTIEKPIFSFPGGRRFEFLDPSGNRLAVWSDS